MVWASTLVLGPRPRSAQIRPKLELQTVYFTARHLFAFLHLRRTRGMDVSAMRSGERLSLPRGCVPALQKPHRAPPQNPASPVVLQRPSRLAASPTAPPPPATAAIAAPSRAPWLAATKPPTAKLTPRSPSSPRPDAPRLLTACTVAGHTLPPETCLHRLGHRRAGYCHGQQATGLHWWNCERL
jgi:hypothetical protein